MSGKITFLAVDDDPVFHLVLAEMMQDLGYSAPQIAESGREAITMLAHEASNIDAVLLDITMPDMDGIEVCRRIRALKHHRDTPIMMITTMKGRNHVNYAFNAGATDYLTKPLDKLELSARLGMLERLVVERRRSRTLQQDLEGLSDLPGIGFRFEDPVPLPFSDHLIDFLALQNYLLTLGRLRLRSQVALGFRVEGAEGVYNRLRRIDYLDFLAEASDAIAGALKRHFYYLAHAGSGEFVGILGRIPSLDISEIELEIAANLANALGTFESLGLPLPVVRVGSPQHASIFRPSAAEAMIQKAVKTNRIVRSAHFAQKGL